MLQNPGINTTVTLKSYKSGKRNEIGTFTRTIYKPPPEFIVLNFTTVSIENK